MFLDAVILVLREVLEAAFLLCVLLVYARLLGVARYWFWAGFALAGLGVVVYAGNLERITDALEGAGQEVVNASLQILVYLLVIVVLGLGAAARRRDVLGQWLPWPMALAVGLALVRESAEILIYVHAFSAFEEFRLGVYAGSLLGAGIGVSAGVLAWSALRALGPMAGYRACFLLLSVIGAGMVMQATLLLEQVDWLPAQEPVWNSSVLLSEQSLMGQLLFAVLGYEATPGPLQLSLYLVCLVVAAGAGWWGHHVLGGRYHAG